MAAESQGDSPTRRESETTPRWRGRAEQAVLAATTLIALSVIGVHLLRDPHATIDLSSDPRLVASTSPWRAVPVSSAPRTVIRAVAQTAAAPDTTFAPAPEPTTRAAPSSPASAKPQRSASARFQLDVNKAGLEEWMMLPGIGPTYAARIVELRDREGPFRSHDDLLRVARIGEKTLDRIRPYLLPIAASGQSSAPD